jgi:hypothetical protein
MSHLVQLRRDILFCIFPSNSGMTDRLSASSLHAKVILHNGDALNACWCLISNRCDPATAISLMNIFSVFLPFNPKSWNST